MGYAGLAQKINIKKLSIFKFISLQIALQHMSGFD